MNHGGELRKLASLLESARGFGDSLRTFAHTKPEVVSYLALVSFTAIALVRAYFSASMNFDPQQLNHMYNSLIAKGDYMTDSDYYAWAAWSYVHGSSPDTVNFEHPPLGKYLIGVSELVFNSPVNLGLIVGALTICLVFLIARQEFGRGAAVLASFFMTFDNLFLGFLSNGMPDVYLAFFVVLYVWIYLRQRYGKLETVAFGVTFGLALASKWLAALPFLALLGFACYRRNTPAAKMLLVSVPVAFMTYALTYSAYFWAGHSFSEFISLQMVMANYQQYLRFGRGTPPPFWIVLNFLTGIEGFGIHKVVQFMPAVGAFRTLATSSGFSLIPVFNPFTWTISFSAAILLLLLRSTGSANKTLPSIIFLGVIASMSYGQVFVWYLLPVFPFAFMSLAAMLERIYSDSKRDLMSSSLFLAYVLIVAAWSLFANLPVFVDLSTVTAS